MVHVFLRGQCNRDAYYAGDAFKLLVDVVCADDAVAAQSEQCLIPFDTSKLDSLRYPISEVLGGDGAPPAAADSSRSSVISSSGGAVASARGTSVSLRRCDASLVGVCKFDTSRMVAPLQASSRRPLVDEDTASAADTIVSVDIFPPIAVDMLAAVLTGEAAPRDTSVVVAADANGTTSPLPARTSPTAAGIDDGSTPADDNPPSRRRVPIMQGFRRALALAGVLPPDAPPSMRSQVARVEYKVIIHCVWEADRSDGAKLMTTTLRVPLHVLSPLASLSLLRWPFYHPVLHGPRHTLRAIALPARPSPRIAAPLCDELVANSTALGSVSDVVACPSTTLMHQEMLHGGSCVDIPLRHSASGACVASLLLNATVLRVGEPLLGALSVESTEGGWYCVSVDLALEVDELLPFQLVKRGTTIPAESRRIIAHPSPCGFHRAAGTPLCDVLDPPHCPAPKSSSLSVPQQMVEYVVMQRRTVCSAAIDARNAVQVAVELNTFVRSDATAMECKQTVDLEWLRVQYNLRIILRCSRRGVAMKGADECALDEYEVPLRVVAERPLEHSKISLSPGSWHVAIYTAPLFCVNTSCSCPG